MKWLKIEYIKQHSRIDYDCEDEMLELYGEAAEDTILSWCNRSYEDLIKEFGKVPAGIVQASLLLTAQSYKEREPASGQNLSAVPYGTIDTLIKHYMIL